MLFANVCAGFIRSCYGEFWDGMFWVFWLLFCVLCAWEVLVLLVLLLRTRLGLLWCAACWTRLFGGGRWVYYLCNHWRDREAANKIAYFYLWFYDYFINGKPYMPALSGTAQSPWL